MPNLNLLANALAQSRWKGPEVKPNTWRKILRRRITGFDWPAVVRDVEPFLEDPGDLRLLNRKLLLAEFRRDE